MLTSGHKSSGKPQKHELEMDGSPFKHSCKSPLDGEIADGPRKKLKIKWFPKKFFAILYRFPKPVADLK